MNEELPPTALRASSQRASNQNMRKDQGLREPHAGGDQHPMSCAQFYAYYREQKRHLIYCLSIVDHDCSIKATERFMTYHTPVVGQTVKVVWQRGIFPQRFCPGSDFAYLLGDKEKRGPRNNQAMAAANTLAHCVDRKPILHYDYSESVHRSM